MFLPNLFAQRAVFALQQLPLLGLSERQHDLVRFERLLNVVVGAGLHGFDRQVHVAVGAHDDHGGVVVLGLQRRQQVEAAHLGHSNVGQHEIGPKESTKPSASSPLAALSTS
jgi:hypothetical protein